MARASPNHVEQAIAAFDAAPFEPEQWDHGLRLLGEICGGWTAQLLAVGHDGDIRLNHIPLMPPDATAEWEEWGGAIPERNPRAATLFAAPFSITSDDDILPRAAQESSAFYRELFDRFEARFMLVGTLPPAAGLSTIVGVLRARRQNHPDRADVEAMMRLLPHVHAAFSVQNRISDRDLRRMIDFSDHLDQVIFVCDRRGKILAHSAAADRLLADGRLVRLKMGVLRAVAAHQDEPLQVALRRASGRRGDRSSHVRASAVALSDPEGRACRVDIAPLAPAVVPLLSGAACIVQIALPRPVGEPRRLLTQAFGLSPAEAAVALDLASGMTASEIAAGRGVSTETVRVQVRAVLQKTGVSKATALAALVGRFNL